MQLLPLISSWLPVIFIFLSSIITTTSAQEAIWTFSEFIPETYDKSQPPVDNDHPFPINVTINVIIDQLIAVHEAEQSYTIDVIYTQKWPDHRLKFPPRSYKNIPMDTNWLNRLWMPSVYITNSLSPNMFKLAPLYLEIESNTSQILMTARHVVKLKCLMNLFRFPMDSQTCPMQFTLLTTSKEKAALLLEKFSVTSLYESFPNNYLVEKPSDPNCTSIRGQDYSCVATHLKFFRNISYYIIRIYGPSFLMVITSFVAFWIPPAGYPARVMITVTPLLALITQQVPINSEIKVSYVVAVHLWMIMCEFFCFMSLIEYAMAIVYVHAVDEKKSLEARDPVAFTFSYDSGRISHFVKTVLNRIYGEVDYKKNPMDRNKVDYVARILYPVLFFTFIIIYILVFLVPWAASKYYYDL